MAITMTFTQQIARVSLLIEDTGNNRWGADPATGPIAAFLNETQREFARLTRVLRKRSATLAVAATTPVNAFWTLPDDFLELESGGVWVTDAAGNERQLDPLSVSQMPDGWSTVTGAPSGVLDLQQYGLTELRIYPYDGPAWTALTAYAVGATVTNGGNVYTCTTAGTSAGSGGPTGTGTGITDDSAVWNYTRLVTTLHIFYSYIPANLTSGSAVMAIPGEYHDVLCYRAAALCLLTNSESGGGDNAQAWMAIYDRAVAEAKVRQSRRFTTRRQSFYQEPF